MQSDTNLGYLLHHLTSVLDRQSDVVLQEALGIGFSQFKILLALQWQSNVQQKQIAGWLGQTEASVSRQIRVLREKKLVQNTLSPSNRRQHVMILTSAGDTLAKKAAQVLNDCFVPLTSTLTERQQEELVSSLKMMHEQVCYSAGQCACK